jgi:hypothetical protein
VRILMARTTEAHGRIVPDPELDWIERWVLIGEHQRRWQPAITERMSKWCEFDCFGPGADDQPYVSETQSSP